MLHTDTHTKATCLVHTDTVSTHSVLHKVTEHTCSWYLATQILFRFGEIALWGFCQHLSTMEVSESSEEWQMQLHWYFFILIISQMTRKPWMIIYQNRRWIMTSLALDNYNLTLQLPWIVLASFFTLKLFSAKKLGENHKKKQASWHIGAYSTKSQAATLSVYLCYCKICVKETMSILGFFWCESLFL